MKASFWTNLLDVIAPRQCAICGERLSPTESVLCACCHLHLPLTHFEKQAEDNPMARLFWGHFPVERAAALFYYAPQSNVSQLIFDIKYHDHPEIGEQMGVITARQFARHHFFDDIDAIIPVPLTRRRQWKRGYNQSMEIARGVQEVTGLPIIAKALKRLHFSSSQTKKNLWERQENVSSMFHLNAPSLIADKHLLLIDDIVTTGATIKSCAAELSQAENVKISILSLGFTKS